MKNDLENTRRLKNPAEGGAQADALAVLLAAAPDLQPFLTTFLALAPGPVYVKNADGAYVGCNDAFARQIIGLPADQVVGRTVFDLAPAIPADWAKRYHQRDQVLLAKPGSQAYEAPVHCADGKMRHFRISKATFADRTDGRTAGIVAVMHDISAETELAAYHDNLEAGIRKRTMELMEANDRLQAQIEERRKTQAALEASEQRYRRVFDNTGTAMVLIDADMTIGMINARAEELFGFDRSEVVGRARSIDFATPKYREQLRLFHEMRHNGQGDDLPGQYEFQMRDKKGQLRDVLAQIEWIPETRQTVASILDLTDRKQIEKERRRLAAIVDQSSESTLLTNVKGEIEYVNPAFETLSGYTRNELLGQDLELPFFSDDDRRTFQQMTFSVACDNEWSGRTTNQRRDGTTVITTTRISPICDARQKVIHLVCTKKDVTHEVQLERQLHQSQKMEAIGTLAGGIAHDFNNILAGILGYTEMCLRLSESGSRIHHHMGRILEGCQRAKELVNHILTFSRHKDQEVKPVEMQLVVKEALKLLRASLPSTIEIRTDLATDHSVVVADPTQIHQVVMNLCTNSAQAMKNDGGTLTVGLTRHDVTAEGLPGHPDLPEGRYLKLTVSDTGHGMPAEVINRIFEPYFTTKDQGEGTGLGLSVVHGIVSSCGGAIDVASSPDTGTTFALHWPQAETATRAPAAEPDDMPGGCEKILLVDDEELLLEINGEILESLGYRVDTLGSSLKALEAVQKDRHRYNLLISDLTMPRLTGQVLAEKLVRIAPGLPIILCTGYRASIEDETRLPRNIAAVLEKPIHHKKLADTVRGVLDRIARRTKTG